MAPGYLRFNQPNEAECNNSSAFSCKAYAVGNVLYLNWSPDPLDNVSFRPEIYVDPMGWRTGAAATYYNFSIGWQHWLSPQIELRPEVTWYHASKDAFDLGTKDQETIFSGDAIVHF